MVDQVTKTLITSTTQWQTNEIFKIERNLRNLHFMSVIKQNGSTGGAILHQYCQTCSLYTLIMHTRNAIDTVGEYRYHALYCINFKSITLQRRSLTAVYEIQNAVMLHL